MAEKQPRYDIDGHEAVTTALRELLNSYPGLSGGDEISFAVLADDGGKAMFPISGAIIETEKKYILGDVRQICLYPFYVIYRAAGLSENRKAAVKEWLDNLGRWLEGHKVNIDGVDYQLDFYPKLAENRRFLSISRQTPAYLSAQNDNQSEDWAIYITARYQNDFNKSYEVN